MVKRGLGWRPMLFKGGRWCGAVGEEGWFGATPYGEEVREGPEPIGKWPAIAQSLTTGPEPTVTGRRR
jgi:hypothetical protein